MRRSFLLLATLSLALCFTLTGPAPAQLFRRVPPIEGRFHGTVLDFTHNHGADRRIWSNALCQKRDLYVYLPPCYDPTKRYPFMFWLHGITQDEKGFIEVGLPEIDAAIACGRMPPLIIAIPDGSVGGRPGRFSPNSGFLNTHAGRFEDFLFDDVYEFVRSNFPIRPERGAHVLAGASIGGGAAFNHGIRRRDEFGVVLGIAPPLNLRWMGPCGRYFANFDPERWGWREHYCLGLTPVGKFYGGLIAVPWRRLVHPLYGSGHQVVEQMSRDNPIELIDRYNLRDGELDMFVAYGGKDEFNLDAQIESFLYLAQSRGISITVAHDPRGRHNISSARRFIPGAIDWLAQRLEPFRP
ncbi:MAG: alpha/beta hydrolase-fold protein [Gemmataceae bacterium]